MRKVREILRLWLECGKTNREIARSCGVSHTVVNDYLRRAKETALGREQIQRISDEQLRAVLQTAQEQSGHCLRPLPDWRTVHEELRKKSVTLQLLWEEYRDANPDGYYRLSQFYERYRQWKKQLDVSMRQTHKAGEKMFVDYAGQTIGITDPKTGIIRQAQIFVAVLGASNYTYSEATWDQTLPSWIDSHIHAFEYFDGVVELVVPDNLRSGVSKVCRYEPDLNPSYHDMSVHYGTAVMPARALRPRDKAKVEVGVQIVERWILAALRNRTFFSLHELNHAIRQLLEKLNTRSFKKMDGSRRSWFEKIEQPALKPLPTTRYVLREWKWAKVNIDYHMEVEGHYYSAPHVLVGKALEARYTTRTVEIFFGGKRVASHLRSFHKNHHTTQKEHMPKRHQQYLEWRPSRILSWAAETGEGTRKIAEEIMSRRPHPEQGYRSCLGILRLGKLYGKDRLEAACRRALAIGAASYKSIRSILEKGLDTQILLQSGFSEPIKHTNIRGADYYDELGKEEKHPKSEK